MWDCVQNTFSDHADANAAYVGKWLAALDPALAQNWSVRDVHSRYYGMTRAQLVEVCRNADVFINYSGNCVLRDEYLACRKKVYIDSDPLYSQAGVGAYLDGTADEATRWAVECMRQHDKFLSFAENIGTPSCSIPTAIFDWQPTRQPVVLDYWNNRSA